MYKVRLRRFKAIGNLRLSERGIFMFNEICIYEAKIEKQEEIEALIFEDVRKVVAAVNEILKI